MQCNTFGKRRALHFYTACMKAANSDKVQGKASLQFLSPGRDCFPSSEYEAQERHCSGDSTG